MGRRRSHDPVKQVFAQTQPIFGHPNWNSRNSCDSEPRLHSKPFRLKNNWIQVGFILRFGNCHIISTTELKVRCVDYMKAKGFNRSLNFFEKRSQVKCKHNKKNFTLFHIILGPVQTRYFTWAKSNSNLGRPKLI